MGRAREPVANSGIAGAASRAFRRAARLAGRSRGARRHRSCARLRELRFIKPSAAWLEARPQLGRDAFPPGAAWARSSCRFLHAPDGSVPDRAEGETRSCRMRRSTGRTIRSCSASRRPSRTCARCFRLSRRRFPWCSSCRRCRMRCRTTACSCARPSAASWPLHTSSAAKG